MLITTLGTIQGRSADFPRQIVGIDRRINTFITLIMAGVTLAS